MGRYSLILLIFLVTMSCQDTKTKSINQPNKLKINQKKDINKKSEPVFVVNHHPDYRLDTVTRVDQIHLKPYLFAYGKTHKANYVIVHTNLGDIEIQLFKETPLHRANFLHLVNLGYFNATYFYRVVKNFVIQGGNSDNRITAQFRDAVGDFLIPAEFSKAHLNDYGAVGMAKYTEQNVSKASSPFEFYIVMDKQGAHHLDFEHTVFGKVVKGMDVAEKIADVKTTDDSWPVQNVTIKIEVVK